ncbi:hypothetical protein Slin14017_G057570 [Septoria linicola]|nr:hypothetical protein Slin14017_G057570 [Septoria linicola]
MARDASTPRELAVMLRTATKSNGRVYHLEILNGAFVDETVLSTLSDLFPHLNSVTLIDCSQYIITWARNAGMDAFDNHPFAITVDFVACTPANHFPFPLPKSSYEDWNEAKPSLTVAQWVYNVAKSKTNSLRHPDMVQRRYHVLWFFNNTTNASYSRSEVEAMANEPHRDQAFMNMNFLLQVLDGGGPDRAEFLRRCTTYENAKIRGILWALSKDFCVIDAQMFRAISTHCGWKICVGGALSTTVSDRAREIATVRDRHPLQNYLAASCVSNPLRTSSELSSVNND